MDIKTIKIYFDHLSPSDRRMLQLLAGFLILIACYWVLTISFQYRKDAVSALSENREFVSWVLINAESVEDLSAQGRRPLAGEQSLLLTASSIAKERAINFKRVEPKGDELLKVWVENLSFNKLLFLLHKLDIDYDISVQELAVDKKNAEGYVDARVTLKQH